MKFEAVGIRLEKREQIGFSLHFVEEHDTFHGSQDKFRLSQPSQIEV